MQVSLHEKAGCNLRIYQKTQIYLRGTFSVFKTILVQFKKLHVDFIWNIQNLLQIIEVIFARGLQTIDFNCDLLHNLLDVILFR